MNDYQFWVNCAILVATIFAIVYGPLKAVKITRSEDEQREDRARKYLILSDLMRTRQARIDPTHVGALNLVELEFYGKAKVVEAYRAYARHLNSPFPNSSEDEVDRHSENGNDLFTNLLYEIAHELGFTFDKRDLSRLGYLPLGLSRFHDNAHVNAHLLREILEGKRALNIANFVSNQGMFPPTPEKKLLENSNNVTK
ncbi:hypothetical protein GCM10010873_14880 [Cypionkella aquatica]|uniref:DUF6680 domain-containing protein n=1 Tax=Cypionkella aquatica TaxID=1756042 RepID=A0AA37U332_9RHOB|nr:DUF6680 family protein [Cypionkella aquatica]GLS86514.1 hypothetical protein GCM10010873_14880 [Cypionkella aquatica]